MKSSFSMFFYFATATVLSAWTMHGADCSTSTISVDGRKENYDRQDPGRSDWASLNRYRKANAQLGMPPAHEDRVVFYGDSITDSWAKHFKKMFPNKPYVGRGISGQTTPQMLVRFRQDVVALRPAAVVILAGTNDIAGNTGPSTQEMIEDNFKSMVEIAEVNEIRVILASVLPASDYPWRPGLEPAPKITALNKWLKEYAAGKNILYLDYHTSLVNEKKGFRREFSHDGVHPNEAGYQVMARLAEAAISRVLEPR